MACGKEANALDYAIEEAVGKVSKKQRILKLTPVMLEKVREVMEDNQ